MKAALLCCCAAVLFATPVRGDSITLDPGKTAEPISKYIYGQFTEHLGRSIYGGLWAEMLQDRKFFYPITDDFNPYALGSDPNWNAGPYDYLNASPWKVIGPAKTVTMESDHPFTGAQTPAIHLPGAGKTAGISQPELALVAGMKYVGRIVLSGDGGAAPITVRLVGDDGKELAVTINSLTADFKTYPLEFTATANSDQARVEIVSNGSGVFRVGAVSLMPADNIDGWRADTVARLKELNSPIYRWPGGNFVSGYNWRDGIGDRDTRPPRKNPAWKSIEANDVGIHEFMHLMEIIHSQPYVALNTGLGTAEEATAEVAYLNGPASGEMGMLRAKNGHPDPFNIAYFAVGNEMFGNWQLGHMPLEQYVQKHNTIADSIWKVDSGAKLVAVGNLGTWDQTMLKVCADHMTLLSEHIYVKELPDPIAHTAQLADQIKRVADAHRGYRRAIPELAGKDIRIAMDEWNYWYGNYVYGELGCQYHFKDGLGVARGLHEYFRNSDLFFMANYAQTVNVIGAIKTDRTHASLESTGLVLAMYRNHFGTIPITIAQQPAGLDVSAAWTDDRKAITVSIINVTKNDTTLTVDLVGGRKISAGRRWTISASDYNAANIPGQKPAMSIIEDRPAADATNLPAPAMSIQIFELPV